MKIYGQPTGLLAYNVIDIPIFLYWMPVLKVVGKTVQYPFAGGYKVHVSAALEDAERVAEHVLPILQDMKVSHKVVYPLDRYASMNEGDQKGKFIYHDLCWTADVQLSRSGEPSRSRPGGDGSHPRTTSNGPNKRTSPTRTASWPKWSPDLRYCR